VRQRITAMDTFVEGEARSRTAPFPGHMLDRAQFDARLVADAERAGAQCRFATAVRAIECDGAVPLPDGTRVAPRVLIGADGPRSIVGRAIAFDDYADELDAMFGLAIARALHRREELLRATPAPSPAELRRGWIAYPEYWTEATSP
jgi:flavin-dependent dehydrogenase